MQEKAFNKISKVKAAEHFIIVTFLFLLLCFVLIALENKIRPMMISVAAIKSKELCVNKMQGAIETTLKQNPEIYQDLFLIEKDEKNVITGAVCDSLKLITLQNNLETEITKAMSEVQNMDLKIPVGTLSGIQAFAGKGIALSCTVLPNSAVQSRVETKMESAGINQTLLKAELVASVEIRTMLAGLVKTEKIENKICIAQIAVVGKTPEIYAHG